MANITRRCGKCAGCTRQPTPTPCRVWIEQACQKFQKELRSKREGISQVLRDFDNRHED